MRQEPAACPVTEKRAVLHFHNVRGAERFRRPLASGADASKHASQRNRVPGNAWTFCPLRSVRSGLSIRCTTISRQSRGSITHAFMNGRAGGARTKNDGPQAEHPASTFEMALRVRKSSFPRSTGQCCFSPCISPSARSHPITADQSAHAISAVRAGRGPTRRRSQIPVNVLGEKCSVSWAPGGSYTSIAAAPMHPDAAPDVAGGVRPDGGDLVIPVPQDAGRSQKHRNKDNAAAQARNIPSGHDVRNNLVLVTIASRILGRQ